MTDVFITGIAGSLGSSLARLFLEKGHNVKGNDIARIEEAWKLDGVKDEITYLWKSSTDLMPDDIAGSDVIIDCGLGVADRPLGISSPSYTFINNILPPLRILELIRRMPDGERPTAIYPSSFNALYGYPPGTCYTESLLPNPSSQYGWSKASAESLYTTYMKAYQIPAIITRVGSAYGARMRHDELMAKLILKCMKKEPFRLKSPLASRLWTYSKDVLSFYDILVQDHKAFRNEIFHCAGNLSDKVVANLELANMVKNIINNGWDFAIGEYEPGEVIDGQPIRFTIDSTYTRDKLNWKPKYSLEQGILELIAWYRLSLER